MNLMLRLLFLNVRIMRLFALSAMPMSLQQFLNNLTMLSSQTVAMQLHPVLKHTAVVPDAATDESRMRQGDGSS
jgi:hypothetical protein